MPTQRYREDRICHAYLSFLQAAIPAITGDVARPPTGRPRGSFLTAIGSPPTLLGAAHTGWKRLCQDPLAKKTRP